MRYMSYFFQIKRLKEKIRDITFQIIFNLLYLNFYFLNLYNNMIINIIII